MSDSDGNHDLESKPTQRLVAVAPNPLTFVEAESPIRDVSPPGYEALLRFLGEPSSETDLEKTLERYKEISKGIHSLPFAPAERRILEKLIWPLRHAMGSYMTGNCLGTIAMCGMVVEMIAILIFDLCEVNFCGKRMDEAAQRQVFGETFEKLGQERRVRVLDGFGMIDQPLKSAFDEIRTTRRKYLHLWSQDHDQLPADAVRCFNNALTIVASIIGARVNGWAVAFDTRLERYLAEHGQFSEVPPTDGLAK